MPGSTVRRPRERRFERAELRLSPDQSGTRDERPHRASLRADLRFEVPVASRMRHCPMAPEAARPRLASPGRWTAGRTRRRPMRALYLFLDRTTGVGRPRHTADEPLTPIRSGAFAAWLAARPAGPRVPAGGRVHAGTSRPNDGTREVNGRAADRARVRARSRPPGPATCRRRRGRSRAGRPPRRRPPSPSAGASAGDFGQVYGVVPPNGTSPSRTSATPEPSVPGSQAATTASAFGQMRSSMTGPAGQDDHDEPVDAGSHGRHDVDVRSRQRPASRSRPRPRRRAARRRPRSRSGRACRPGTCRQDRRSAGHPAALAARRRSSCRA